MPVSFVLSSENGGTALEAPYNLGAKANGQATDALTLYLRHDGADSVTDMAFYIVEYSDVYTGDATAAADYTELKDWGDGVTSPTFGGLQINQNATGAFPSASWPLFDSPISADGFGHVFNSDQGSTSLNAIDLLSVSGADATGELQAGSAPNVRVQLRLAIPDDEDTTGVRLFDLRWAYTYTS